MTLCCKISITIDISTCFRGEQTDQRKCETIENCRKILGNTTSIQNRKS